MKGWRTLGFNLLITVGPALLTWASGIDWTQYVSAETAVLIVGGVNLVLRVITTTPVGKSS